MLVDAEVWNQPHGEGFRWEKEIQLLFQTYTDDEEWETALDTGRDDILMNFIKKSDLVMDGPKPWHGAFKKDPQFFNSSSKQ